MTEAIPVLVAGGGPVGLAVALEIAHQGIRSVVIEPREEVSWLRPRAKTTSARTMELFRRWGLAEQVRARAALPVGWSDRAVFTTGLLGREITHIDHCFGLDLTGDHRAAEPGQQIPQPAVEQVLRDTISGSPLVTLRTGWRVVDLTEDEHGVTAAVIDPHGQAQRIRAEFLVGADGATSTVRAAIGARYEGSADERPNYNIVFRSPGLADRVPHGPAVHYWVLHPTHPGMLGRLDLADTWWCIAQNLPQQAGDADPLGVVRGLVGADIPAEILATDPWKAKLLLADRYHSDRVFLAGDAAHLNPPWGGHGFNTGIGDAVNLGWKLAAVLRGWAPRSLLPSYQDERRPIAARTIAEAARNMSILAPELSDARLTGTDAEFAAVRARVAEAVHRDKSGEFHSLDLVLDYTYQGSPLVGARSGARLPHHWLGPGESLYDLLGPGFTLLGPAQHPLIGPFTDAAAEHRIPLHVVARSGHRLTLIRPDQHVAWTDTEPGTPREVLRRATGYPR
ncbi:FAD-dependent monooxygenase [Amycolatopsis sp. cmx-11-32]|uniref:FAD-dependent monooxygenase n=1 Tax=Amycolatopsis sp. cmx-11-32 TaxID=2785796 RepID=UPI0039E5ABE1